MRSRAPWIPGLAVVLATQAGCVASTVEFLAAPFEKVVSKTETVGVEVLDQKVSFVEVAVPRVGWRDPWPAPQGTIQRQVALERAVVADVRYTWK